MAKISRKEAARFLAKVPSEYVFRCADSCVMGDMKELAQALASMSDETFQYHANEAKNDFSTWVTDIIGDRELAAGLREASSKALAAEVVANRVAFLTRRAA